MPNTRILFGVQVGTGASAKTTFFEEVKSIDIPQDVLEEGEEAVKEYLHPQWEGWVDLHTSSIIELIDEQ